MQGDVNLDTAVTVTAVTKVTVLGRADVKVRKRFA